jgi:hypothetical protein
MSQDKPMAVYTPKAMKAEADEVRSMELMKKRPEKMPMKKPMPKVAKPKPKDFKMAPETSKLLKKMAKGGSVSKRADGCATKGKTKGRMI